MDFSMLNGWEMLKNVHISGSNAMEYLYLVLFNRKLNAVIYKNVENQQLLNKILKVLATSEKMPV